VETPTAASVVDQVEPPPAEPVLDEVEPPIEAPTVEEVEPTVGVQVAEPAEMPSEPPIDIAERLASHPPEPEEKVIEEPVVAETPPPADKFQSGLLQKHLDTKPKEEKAEVEQVVEEMLGDEPGESDSEEALETLEEIIDEEISAQGSEDQLTIEEDFFENLEKELSFDGGDDVLDLVDAPSAKPVQSPPAEGSKTKDSSWPPQRPSEMNDFEEYK
jgi:hypothetical protein